MLQLVHLVTFSNNQCCLQKHDFSFCEFKDFAIQRLINFHFSFYFLYFCWFFLGGRGTAITNMPTKFSIGLLWASATWPLTSVFSADIWSKFCEIMCPMTVHKNVGRKIVKCYVGKCLYHSQLRLSNKTICLYILASVLIHKQFF